MSPRNRENAEHYSWGPSCDGWRHLDRPDLSVIQERMPPGATETAHVHQHARQVFFVLRGTLRVELADQRYDLNAEDSIEVEPGAFHRVSNSETSDAWFLVISSPSTSGDREELPSHCVSR